MRTFVIALVLISLPAVAVAHDHWLEAEPFQTAQPAAATKVYVVGGKYFAESAFMPFRMKSEYTRFQELSSAGARDVTSELREDSEPVAVLADLKAGSHVLALDAAPTEIDLDAEAFGAYLLEERLIDVLVQRADRGQEDAKVRERYTRHLKIILQVGAPGTDKVATKPVGQKLEIVPMVNPYAVAVGGTLTVQVLLDGKPLVGRAVTARNRNHGAVTRQTVRTDKDGKATFKVNKSGQWLLKTIAIAPSTEKGIDWQSEWATLSFGTPDHTM